MKKIFNVHGMTCVSCELLITKELKKVLPHSKIKASCRDNKIEIQAEEINNEVVKNIIEKCGYSTTDNKKKKNSKPKDLKEWISALAILFLILFLFLRLDLGVLISDLNNDVSIIVALLIGLVASVSTCLALTGGLVISFSSTLNSNNERPSIYKRIWPQIYFHLGRIVGFFVLGGLLGLLGEKLQYSNSFAGILTIFVALIMLYIGLNIAGVLPSISNLKFHLPKKIGEKILNLNGNNKPGFISSLGVLSFFLPCGFTQSMQLVAIASGDFWSGALIMSFFALGTIPVLFSVGLGSSYVNNNKFGVFKKFIAVIVIFFSIYSLNVGLGLTGSKYQIDFWNQIIMKNSDKRVASSVKENYQTIQLDIDYNFVQREFTIKKGVPTKFIINAIRVTGCSNEVIVPQFNLKTGKLKNGDRVVLEFTPEKTGVIRYACWMNMITGRIIVK
jgi:uncharacterized protein